MGIGKGDEVITTPFTFFATAEAIAHVGATPVFVDIEPGTYNMDVTKIEAAITDRTRAIMPVHIFGQCVDMDAVLELAERHEIAVIEDACQAIGATYKGRKAGGIGHAAAFSFFPSKNLGCAGDGGCITTNDGDLAARAKKLASHGTTVKYYHDALGVNSRLDALQAGILLVKLPHLDRWNAERRAGAARYAELLAGAAGLELPVARDFGDSVYHLYVVKADSAEAAERVMGAMKAAGIGTALYYPLCLHEQEAFATPRAFRAPEPAGRRELRRPHLRAAVFPGDHPRAAGRGRARGSRRAVGLATSRSRTKRTHRPMAAASGLQDVVDCRRLARGVDSPCATLARPGAVS